MCAAVWSCSRRPWPPTAAATRKRSVSPRAHAPGRRAFAVEGTGSYGAGLTRFLTGSGERVFEVGRLRRERRSGGKTDALDAVRAARSVLAQERPATPRNSGEREALRALMAAREGAANAKRAGLCQLRALLVTTPEPLRAELRSLTRARLLARLAAMRPERRADPELRGILLALRAVARRVQQLTVEERELAREIKTLTEKLAPQLLDQPGVGPLLAAQVVLSWSHKGRIRSEAAFARLAGVAPIPASSGQTIRYRLDRSGDRQLNRALHMIIVTRRRAHPATIAYIERRIQRRQDPPRSDPLPQTLPRPQPLPAPRERSPTDRLTNIEASLAQASASSLVGWLARSSVPRLPTLLIGPSAFTVCLPVCSLLAVASPHSQAQSSRRGPSSFLMLCSSTGGGCDERIRRTLWASLDVVRYEHRRGDE